jgi:hypothetical protein
LELPSATPTPKNLTRTGLMLAILPSVTSALNAIPEVQAALTAPLTQETSGTLRRAFRAIVTIGLKMALNAGMPVPVVINELQVALTSELALRQGQAGRGHSSARDSPQLATTWSQQTKPQP